jgi:hypothetical protein
MICRYWACLNFFDHFIKHDLKVRYYGRYVDDLMIIHNEKDYLKSLITEIKNFLNDKLFVTVLAETLTDRSLQNRDKPRRLGRVLYLFGR